MAALERRFSSLDDRVTDGTARITGSFKELGRGLAIFTAGAATVAGAFMLANQADAFVNALEQAGAAANATGEELALMRGAALQAALKGPDHCF